MLKINYKGKAPSKAAVAENGKDSWFPEGFCFSNHMAVRVIWDILPELFFINFQIAARVISNFIKSNKGKISQISWTAITFLLINTTQSDPWRQKTEGWLQKKLLTLSVWLHKEMWLQLELSFSKFDAKSRI